MMQRSISRAIHWPITHHGSTSRARNAVVLQPAKPTRSILLSTRPGILRASPIRYMQETPVDRRAAHYWMPVDQYIGGVEHAIHCICFMPDSSPGQSPEGANCPYRNHFAGLFTQNGMVCHGNLS